MKTGSADLPLHGGKCPAWLFQRMRPLTLQISRIIIDNYGTAELLRRLSNPFFFQALSCIIGFDWHSSGTTTTTCGALKEALSTELGIVCCGGKGKNSHLVPNEILKFGETLPLSDSKLSALTKASKMSARVDQNCIQAGYDLYHHSFLFDEHGNWTVIQQGMNAANRYARRYHWFNSQTFVDEPDNKIAGVLEENVLNLVSEKSREARKTAVTLVNDNPIHIRKYFDGQTTLFDDSGGHFQFPEHHDIRKEDLTEKDWQYLQNVYELQPKNYEELVSLEGMGKKKLRALALVSKLIYGTPLDWKDPVKYSFAHGGKDGIPYPVDRGTYDHTIEFLRNVLVGLEDREKQRALKKLIMLFGN